LLSGLATLLVVTALIFIAVQLLPGDVASSVLGQTATPGRVAAIRSDLGLNDPIIVRYWHFLSGLVTGDLGNSTAALAQGEHVSVGAQIGPALRNTMILAVITTLIFVPLCLFLGTLAALRAGKETDHVISSTALALGSLPEFLVGTLLILIFFTQLDLLPPLSSLQGGQTPLDDPTEMVLPVLTLLAVSLAFGTRLLRASMSETLNLDYVGMARLRGYGQRRVLVRYVLRNALAPSVQILAQMIQWLLGGIIVTESVFNYPGIGSALVKAVTLRDVQTVMVVSTILAALYILINIIADFLVVLLVPKLRARG
jgi:peptide/nickel transport system permease protein